MDLLLYFCGVVGVTIAGYAFIRWSERRDAKAAVREIQAIKQSCETAHARAFSVAASLTAAQLATPHQAVSAAVAEGDDCAEFRQRLPTALFPWPQGPLAADFECRSAQVPPAQPCIEQAITDIGLALCASHGTIATDLPDAVVTDTSWRIDHTHEMAQLAVLQAALRTVNSGSAP